MEPVIDKIKKLLAMAQHPDSNDGEIANAMRAINILVLKHNLELDQFDLSAKQQRGNGIDKSQRIIFGETVEEADWEILLINVLCEFNLCEEIVFTTKGVKGGSFVILGSPLNVECVKYMFEVTRRLYRVLSKRRYNEKRAAVLIEYKSQNLTEKDALKSKDLPYRMPFIRNYLKGCIEGLRIKLEQQRETYDIDTKEMIISNNQAIELYIENEFDPNDIQSTTLQSRTSDDDARLLGRQDALENDIHQGIYTASAVQNLNQTLRLNETNS